MTETQQPYPEPVARLLELGDVRNKEWQDYRALGLSEQDIPELSRMLLDKELYWADGESDEVWSTIHAWRALAQLKAASAIPALIELLGRDDDEDNDWIGSELPQVFAEIGPAAFEPLRSFLADAGHDQWSRLTAGESLVKLGQRYPELRAGAVAAISRQLESFAQQDQTFNSLLIGELLDLQAVEAAPLMARAFAAGKVDLLVQGDWEDVQIELGLLDKRLTPPPDNRALMAAQLGYNPSKMIDHLRRTTRASLQRKAELKAASQAKAKARAKRKQAQQSKKKQRKRK